jgi:hypothetical protein
VSFAPAGAASGSEARYFPDRRSSRRQNGRSDGNTTFAGTAPMNARIKQLRDLVVALDLSDRNLQRLEPAAYRSMAIQALRLTHDEMGLLPITDFAGPPSTLQNLAENIFFGVNRCFADLDGSGRAAAAQKAGTALVQRLRAADGRSGRAIAESLFVRLRTSANGSTARDH